MPIRTRISLFGKVHANFVVPSSDLDCEDRSSSDHNLTKPIPGLRLKTPFMRAIFPKVLLSLGLRGVLISTCVKFIDSIASQ